MVNGRHNKRLLPRNAFLTLRHVRFSRWPVISENRFCVQRERHFVIGVDTEVEHRPFHMINAT